MNTFASVKSSWFKNPDVLACEVAVGHNKSLLGFKNVTISLFVNLSVFDVFSVTVFF